MGGVEVGGWRAGTCVAVSLLMVALACSRASANDELPHYKAQQQVSGVLRSWGSAQMRGLMLLWEEGFHNFQPAVRFQDRLEGTVSALAGVYSGAANFALMGREVWPMESLAYEQMMGYKPTGLEVATGSFDVPTKADALVIFVHRGNPISHLTLAQLDAIFGSEHLRGTRNFRTWGDLGLSGVWAHHRINVYGTRLDSAVAIFFRHVVMKGSLKWNCDIHEFANRASPGGGRLDWGRQIVDALAKDRYGIAISNPYYATSAVKAVALGRTERGPFVAATRQSVLNRSYLLARGVYIFFNQRPGKTMDPAQREFLRYVLSREGQQDVAREGAYLPLPAMRGEREREKLELMQMGQDDAAHDCLAGSSKEAFRDLRGER